MSILLKHLNQLGFTEYFVDNSSLSTILSKQPPCGIYVLHFSNNDIYVGQTINVAKRYVQHCKTFADIIGISFKAVEVVLLNKTEKNLIQQLEKMGFHLRNKVHTSATYAPSTFDEILEPDKQEYWLKNLKYCPNDTPRIDNKVLREKYTRNFQSFMTKPLAQESINFLSAYTRVCIPQPNASEMYYWSCSCLPSKKSLFYRVNLYQQEVLYVYADESKVEVVWRLAKSPIFKNIFSQFWFLRVFQKYNLQWMDYGYSPGGADQFTLIAQTFEDATSVLTNSQFVRAMRTFNLRLMRKGTNLNYRSHCYDLIDRVIG